ncbi:protein kinase [Streptomyces roseicoloratus]|uniref:Protein kinase n=1 Tax=Streptomyces roseicoloratus TaxID=2508722 RepID=A0ABY9RV27_9ACTN|nr:protein kinase [Streptomyces roseicoloratus]WMX45346.1 protein kinase [Streptomyces roseicoloratus]
MLEPLPAGRPPRFAGPYLLLAALGAGGMGEVHLACRTGTPTADPSAMVAVKTVRADLAVDGDFRARFRREITAARAVSGPYTARLVDADADAAVPWLATEYVPGPSLAEAVTATGPLPVEAVRALGVALARALESVHAAKVLHRDLKPANVLLGPAGPKLIDFGIAQAFEATALTSTGLVVGSPGFMSPEHLAGSRAVVPASDVFCLGAVLAFAASGRGPFHDEEMASVVFRISRADAELDAVPAELRSVVERCLRLDPADRPTAAEVAGLLGGGAPEVFPWPGGVLSLLARYGEAAREIGEAAASGAGVADLPTIGPRVPYSPTAMVSGPAVTAAPAERRRRPWVALAAGTAAAVVLATAGVLLLDRDGSGGGTRAGGPSAGGSTGATGGGGANPAASTAPASLDHVVHPAGAEGRTRDFGADGVDLRARPANWSPWSASTGITIGECALTPKALVCTGDGEAVVALRAADGKKLWSKPPRADRVWDGTHSPAVVGDAVWVTGRDGIVGYRWEDGGQVGRAAAPGAPYAVKGTDLRGDVLYTTYVDMSDQETSGGLVTAVSLKGGAPKELWRTRVDVFPEAPVAAGDRVYVPGDGTVHALDARTGGRAGRAAGTDGCSEIVVHEKSVLCPTGDGVEVLDADTLRRTRTIGRGVPVTGNLAVDADGVVAVFDGDRLHAYDLESGAERWSRSAGGEWTAVVGDRVLSGEGTTVYTTPLTNPPDSPDRRSFRLPKGMEESAAAVEGEPVAFGLPSGGAVFLALDNGVVVSGYLP